MSDLGAEYGDALSEAFAAHSILTLPGFGPVPGTPPPIPPIPGGDSTIERGGGGRGLDNAEIGRLLRGNIDGLRHGGGFSAGLHLVGENGIELIDTRTSGVAHSNAALIEALKGVGGRGGVTQEFNITALSDGDTIEAQVDRAGRLARIREMF